MKNFRFLLVLFALCGFSGFAKADPIDFQFQVLDPTFNGNFLDGSPFQVVFGPSSSCPPGVTAQGCYFGLNVSNYTFTSLHLTFANSKDGNPNSLDALNSQPASCLTSGAGNFPAVFGNASCALTNDVYVLDYSGGGGLAPGHTLILAEYGPNPGAFGIGNATVTTNAPTSATTPEPSSVLLLSSGMLFVGFVFVKRESMLGSI